MPSYTAPVEDMMFLFEKLRDNKNYNELEKYKEVSVDLVKDILEEAAKINQNLILPLAKVGDENPAVLENGIVRTPPGYKEAYQKYIEDGWTSLSCDPKYGGQGMPKTVSAFFDEMLSSASLSFKLYSELSIGAYNCINHHASEEIARRKSSSTTNRTDRFLVDLPLFSEHLSTATTLIFLPNEIGRIRPNFEKNFEGENRDHL